MIAFYFIEEIEAGISLLKLHNEGELSMKNTGIVRQLDVLGRITIPIELRRSLGIGDREALEIYTEDNKIVLAKYEPADIFTGSQDDLVEFHGKLISKDSIRELSQLAGLI